MYPGQGMMPGIVMAMRSPNPQASLQQWVAMCESPAFRQFLLDAFDPGTTQLVLEMEAAE